MDKNRRVENLETEVRILSKEVIVLKRLVTELLSIAISNDALGHISTEHYEMAREQVRSAIFDN